MPWFLPDEFLPVHRLAFEWHDALVRFITVGEAEQIHSVTLQLRDPSEQQSLEGIHDGEEVADWLERNGYGDVLDEHTFRHLVIALLADFCHFVYEALRCSEKGKLTVTYNLLRKPLRDNLLYMEWMLADRAGFMSCFRQGGKVLDAAALDRDGKLAIIRGAMAKGQFEDGLSPEDLYELRYDKSSAFGFEATWHKAVHLVTTTKQYPTEPYNLNFVFSDDEDRQSQWQGLYPPLILLLVHTWHVVDALVSGFAPDFTSEGTWEAARRVSGLLVHGHQLGGEEAVGIFKTMLDELFEVAEGKCPACGVVLAADASREALERFHHSGAVRCPGCGASVVVTDDEDETAEGPDGDAQSEEVRIAFARWADDAGVPEGDRTEAAFAAFAAGWEARPGEQGG